MGKNDIGNTAREMAAAPLPPRPEPPPAVEVDDDAEGTPALGRIPANPLGFSSVVFRAANVAGKVYEEDGRKTKKIAAVLVELGSSKHYLKGSVKLVMYPGRVRAVKEFGFFGAKNQGSCLAGDDPSGLIAVAGVRAAVVKLHGEWSKGQTQITYVPAGAVETDDTF
jgi:hypothetical protein